MRTERLARLSVHLISLDFEGERHDGAYVYEEGIVTVSWYNPNDFRRHQLGKASSNPTADAPKLLHTILVSAKYRGEL